MNTKFPAGATKTEKGSVKDLNLYRIRLVDY